MNRIEFLQIVRQREAHSTLSLEIGALHKPHLTGASTRYLDVYTTQQLQEKYKNDPNVNVKDIVEVSYLNFDEIQDSSVDLVFSSHNVEHQPNLVKHFETLSRILSPKGEIFFCIPDYRHCFDHYKNVSTIADVLGAYIEKRSRPSPFNILEQHLFSSKNRHHWDDFEDSEFTDRPAAARLKQIYNLALDFENYKDVHCWKFTPESFSFIIECLVVLELTDLRLVNLYPTRLNTSEFFVHLKKLQPLGKSCTT
jgi:SAM-dependent methyltransferase